MCSARSPRSVAQSRFRGEWVNRRKGEWARRRYSSILSRTDDPFLWVIDHAHELAKDAFVRVIDCLEFGIADVAVTKCELDVHLCFGSFTFGIAKFGDESRGVAPFPPRLGNVCTNRTRRAPDLICQRIPFFSGKFFAQFIYAQSSRECILVNIQIPKMSDRFCRFSASPSLRFVSFCHCFSSFAGSPFRPLAGSCPSKSFSAP